MAPLFRYINNLSVSQKIILAEDLWDSVLDIKSESMVSDREKDHVDKALMDLNENPGSGLSWNIVKERIKNTIHA